eukprot:359527-Chlamydomonas_euryale.AAC.1
MRRKTDSSGRFVVVVVVVVVVVAVAVVVVVAVAVVKTVMHAWWQVPASVDRLGNAPARHARPARECPSPSVQTRSQPLVSPHARAPHPWARRLSPTLAPRVQTLGPTLCAWMLRPALAPKPKTCSCA